jgi:NTE family protein
MPDDLSKATPPRSVSMVLAGGVAMGAYEAGAYAGLHGQAGLMPEWFAGSSIGAVTAAIVAGSPVDERVARLRQFWDAMAGDPLPIMSFWLGYPAAGPWRQALNERSALDTLIYGRPGLFRPRLAPGARVGAQDVPALFDLQPLRDRLTGIIDFGLLNSGAIRLSLCCTDVITGDRVVFDTGRGERIGVDHIVASCALLPVFAPVEVEGRLLADGGLAANTPLDLVLDDNPDREMLCFVVELFARQGSRPHTLAASASRAGDLAFGNQTRRILEGRQREYALRSLIGRLAAHLPAEVRDDAAVAAILAEGRTDRATVATVAYRAELEEAGLFKVFDFSRATLADRWQAGEAAIRKAVATIRTGRGDRDATLNVIEA